LESEESICGNEFSALYPNRDRNNLKAGEHYKIAEVAMTWNWEGITLKKIRHLPSQPWERADNG
jgi:hypothetical protein